VAANLSLGTPARATISERIFRLFTLIPTSSGPSPEFYSSVISDERRGGSKNSRRSNRCMESEL